MTEYVLVPGAGGDAWYWHLVVPELRRRGHRVGAVDLPGPDESAGLAEYAAAIVAAIEGPEPVLVAQSLGGFSAPLVCDQVPVRRLILLNAMVPLPGETAGDWWGNTGQPEARRAFAVGEGRTPRDGIDLREDFFHDVPAEITEQGMAGGYPEADIVFGQPWPLPAWPDVPTRFLQSRDDRLFPLEFQRRVVAERLGIPVHELPGGHLVALSRPVELADRIEELTGD